ncbi:MAG: helix-turn-helix domain-containing protein [Dissulfurimicrobium sp.]|uniref:helix-turn-helix domain-containing protein n=1 Tax=Dissulfurimicrobium hydrothermale TaxID=1750598 RepID=UPI001EDB670B|nr:helix-turn-helix domain-containing protein [Dissulfurimicrobium hydrothermale]UKL12936.1 helix-turn-helix domain-containing protein [Dissulfurimicrobium hydrothermale]
MDKTFLAIKDVALKLGVSDKTIYRMLNENQLPFAVKIGGQWRFRADAMEDWINAQTNTETGNRRINSAITVHKAIENGTVIYRVQGGNRDEAIDELLSAIPYSASFDKKAIKISIFANESLVSSSLKGIAFMTPSVERPVFFERTMLIVAFLEEETDFKAMDDIKTSIIFLTLPANRAEQAIIDMKLRRLSMDNEFIEGIKLHMTRKELLSFIQKKEGEIFSKRP